MIKARLVVIFATMVSVLAVSAAPAFAEFSSRTGQTKGTGKSGPIVLEGGGATLECTSAEGEWKIRGPGKIEDNGQTKQVPQLKGPHLNLTIAKWNACKATTSQVKGVAAEVGECTLQLVQQPQQLTAQGGVVSACTVKTKVLGLGCTITTPAAKEQEKVNFGLEKNVLENSGSNLLTVAEDNGITTKPAGSGCLGVKETNEAKQKGTVTNEGLEAF
jgi:hypothetical protein